MFIGSSNNLYKKIILLKLNLQFLNTSILVFYNFNGKYKNKFK